MTHDLLSLLLEYHYWARDRLLAAVTALSTEQYARPLESSFTSIRDTLTHLYFTEWIWYCRWQGQSPSGPPAEDCPDVATLRARWSEHERKVRAFVQASGDVGIHRAISYTRFAGQPCASPLWHMVVHLVNHGSYHRGQVTTLLRQMGAAPAESMDLITFLRDRGEPAQANPVDPAVG